MSIEKVDDTTIKVVDLKEIEELLSQPGADSIITGETKKPNLFTAKVPDALEFIDKPDNQKTPEEIAAEAEAVKIAAAAGTGGSGILDEVLNPNEEEEEDNDQGDGTGTSKKPGITKEGLLTVTNKLIEKGLIIPFEDDKPLEKYTMADFEELIEANFSERERKIREETPAEFYDSLPEELQYAAKYVADGGKNLKGLFRMLAQSEEIKELDVTTEVGQSQIIRNYLSATNFGTPEDIEEELNAWKDRGELEVKANKFKPKLDAMQEQLVAKQLIDQEGLKKKSQAQAQAYMENVYKVLEPAELNGIKLDKKTQSMLYTGLVQANYPSVSGRQTNLLGHLLEKHQFVEPNHSLIAEALWLLADPEGYKAKVKEVATKVANEKTVRMLKTEEGKKTANSGSVEEIDNAGRPTKLKRPSQPAFFKR